MTCPLRSLLGTTFYFYTKYGFQLTRLYDIQLQLPELSAQSLVGMHDVFWNPLASHEERCFHDELCLDDRIHVDRNFTQLLREER